MKRRTFLRSLGVAGLGLAGATIWRLESNHVLGVLDGPAFALWAEWQKSGTHPLDQLVQAAVLAANPHNSQPWKFHLLPDSVDVYADTSRRIGMIDPLLREMHIGVGCAVENLLLAAETAGYRWSFSKPESSVDSNLQPMVRVLLKEDMRRPSDLYGAIPRRHTNRGRYDLAKEVTRELIEVFNGLKNSDLELRVFWFRTPHEKRAFGDLVVSATEAIITDEEQSKSSARWMRTNWSDIQRFRDGLTYDTQGLPSGTRTLAKFMPPLSRQQTDQYWLTATRETHVATAGAFGMIAIRDARDTEQQVEAGRLWQRMHLLATVHGIAMHPLSQPVERRDREIQLGQSPTYTRALFALQQDDSWQAVMPFRLGFPVQDAPPSPRRAIADVLI
jgi:hypothetical protein